MTNTEKIEKINTLIEETNVTIQDDYTQDIFKDENGNEIFSVMSSRGFLKHPEKEEEVLIEIIKELEKFRQQKIAKNILKRIKK